MKIKVHDLPEQGEIWLVKISSQMQLAVVITAPHFQNLDCRLVSLLRPHEPIHNLLQMIIPLEKQLELGLLTPMSIDCAHVHTLHLKQFAIGIGKIDKQLLRKVRTFIGILTEVV